MKQEKWYQQPSIVIVEFSLEDVLTISGGTETSGVMTPGKDYDDGTGWAE